MMNRLSVLCCLLLPMVLSGQDVELDSFHVYTLDQKGREILFGKAYYEYLPARNAIRSQYYQQSGKAFREVNTQLVLYGKPDQVIARVTQMYRPAGIDSTVYSYNEDGILTRERKFKHPSKKGDPLEQFREIRYLDLDTTGRKTRLQTAYFENGALSREQEIRFNYIYDDRGLLAQRTECVPITARECDPRKRLLQTFDAEGRISSVQDQRYDPATGDFRTLQAYRYEYAEDQRTAYKTLFNLPTGKVYHRTELITHYLPGEERVRSLTKYDLDEKNRRKLVKRNIYFYGEK